MKNLITLVFAVIFSSIVLAQDYNTIVIDDKTEKPILIGYCTREAFDDTTFSEWWNEEYDLYEVDVTTSELVKPGFNDVEIILVMGTWCSDSRREVPRFYKVLDEIEYPSEDVSLINVNRDMEGWRMKLMDWKYILCPRLFFTGMMKRLAE